MHVIEHPDSYRVGTRVLMLKSRHKDGFASERHVLRVTHSIDQFRAALAELVSMGREGERIYGAAGERDMLKAVRLFRERQLAAEYDSDPLAFYRGIDARWESALMAPTSQTTKLWLFDCDTPEDAATVEAELAEHYDRPQAPYRYASKSGVHIVVSPFNRTKLSDRVSGMIHENPIILWAY